MSYKTLLVHLNDEHRLNGPVSVATALAKANDGHVIGLSVLPPIIVVPGGEGAAGAVIEDHRDTYREQMARMKESFLAATAAAQVSAEWREMDSQIVDPFGNVSTVLVDQARNADLVIANQTNPEWLMSGYLDTDDSLILDTGRPVLLVPRIGAPQTIAQRVLVAWDGRREAVRAVFDALPILQRAEYVGIVSINRQSDADASGYTPGADVTAALKRHGVACGQIQDVETSGSVGPTLLETAQTGQCDLIVMGCYGHSRLREFVFGGATRHILENTTLPVLMSH